MIFCLDNGVHFSVFIIERYLNNKNQYNTWELANFNLLLLWLFPTKLKVPNPWSTFSNS